jgi:hypothetical protein
MDPDNLLTLRVPAQGRAGGGEKRGVRKGMKESGLIKIAFCLHLSPPERGEMGAVAAPRGGHYSARHARDWWTAFWNRAPKDGALSKVPLLRPKVGAVFPFPQEHLEAQVQDRLIIV